MSSSIVMQSTLQHPSTLAERKMPHGPVLLRPRTGRDWLAYFRANTARLRPIPRETGPGATPAELAAIRASLQAWQLGETSDGKHLQAAAARYANKIGEVDYLAAVELFIREEQRHGELLGEFLDSAGIERTTANWGDSLFRRARYFVTDMEVWTTPVVMVETLALVYYNAIRRATRSAALAAICAQILSDEVPHLHFSCERLAYLYRRRRRFAFHLTMLSQRILFAVVVTLVWVGHRRALRAGGYSWRRYRRAARDRMNACWRWMDPSRYRWDETSRGACSPEVPRESSERNDRLPAGQRISSLTRVDYRSARDSVT
jgi:hypothetical protein